MFWRLGVEVDKETFRKFKELCRKRRQKLYPEVEEVLSKVKDHGFKNATSPRLLTSSLKKL